MNLSGKPIISSKNWTIGVMKCQFVLQIMVVIKYQSSLSQLSRLVMLITCFHTHLDLPQKKGECISLGVSNRSAWLVTVLRVSRSGDA